METLFITQDCLGVHSRGMVDVAELKTLSDREKNKHQKWHKEEGEPMCSFELLHWDEALRKYVPGTGYGS